MTISATTTRDDLKASLLDLSKRSDLSAKFDEFIALAETSIFRETKVRATEMNVSGDAVEYIPFPAGLGNITRLEITVNNTRYVLNYESPSFEDTTAGRPFAFTVQEDQIRVMPPPSGAYTYTLHYIPNITPLSASNTSNWVLLNAPDVYLYGAMCHLARYTFDDEAFSRWTPMFQGAMDAVNRNEETRRLPISGGLQIKPRSAR